MITRDELRRIAQMNGVPLHTQEKDYIQNLFLFRLYLLEEAENLVLKGGTCLKLFYGSNRFSEDLDFTLLKMIDIESLLSKAVSDLSLVGIKAEVNKEKYFIDGFTCRLKYRGPLYTGDKFSIGSIRIDISFRGDVFLEPSWKLLTPPYPDIRPFFTLCMDVREIFAEKIRALLIRAKPRDVYDVWFLLQRKVELDKEILLRKLEVVSREPKFQLIEIDEETMRRDLRLLLPQPINYRQILEEVNNYLSRILTG